MNKRKLIFTITVTFLLLGLGSCRSWADRYLPNPGPPMDPTQSLEDSSQEEPKEIEALLICPEKPHKYVITYFHYQHLNIDPGTGEKIDITFENIESPGELDVWIDEHGIITPVEGNEPIDILVYGAAYYPGSDDCSEQEIWGLWELNSILSGKCNDGKILIDIEHFYEEPDLEVSCGGIPSLIQSFVSGPEQILLFDLTDDIPSYIVDYGEGTQFHVRYAYYFTEDAGYIDIQDLVPTSD
jgi:hypothetical protein